MPSTSSGVAQAGMFMPHSHQGFRRRYPQIQKHPLYLLQHP